MSGQFIEFGPFFARCKVAGVLLALERKRFFGGRLFGALQRCELIAFAGVVGGDLLEGFANLAVYPVCYGFSFV